MRGGFAPASRVRSTSPGVSGPSAGLMFAANNAANSDVRLKLNGSNLPSRTGVTVLWESMRNSSITGYVTDFWFAYDDGVFHADEYEVGGHPYPANSSSVDGTGQSTDPGGGSGTTHYMEMAGLGARDQISTPGTAVLATKDGVTRRRHALQIALINSNTQIQHRYYPSLLVDSTNYFERVTTAASLPSPSAPSCYWGTSDWRSGSGGADTNDETPNGMLRGFCIINSGSVSQAQMAAIAACETDAAVLAYLASQGLTAFFLNMNPTPTDITDKSGNGRNASWANALRPAPWTPP